MLGGDEQALLDRAKRSPEGVAEVYDRYHERVYAFLLKRARHRETAEDLTAKTFMKFIEALPTIEWQGFSLGAWLFRVASNALTDHWRNAGVRLSVELDTESWDPPSQEESPSWYAELSLESDKVREAIKHLSPRDQEILDLRFFAGQEIAEIAAQKNIQPNHASVLVYRALGRLRTTYLSMYAT